MTRVCRPMLTALSFVNRLCLQQFSEGCSAICTKICAAVRVRVHMDVFSRHLLEWRVGTIWGAGLLRRSRLVLSFP